MKKGQLPIDIPADLNLLDEEDRRKLTAEAKAMILKEMQQDARDKYFEQETKRLRREHVPSQQFIRITINSAEYVPCFMLDGDRYYNGYTYDVPRNVAAVLMEQMQRSWQHQEEINGRSRYNAYRLPLNRTIGLQHQGVVTPGFAGSSVVDADSVHI
jgi:hypothetical protein